MATTITNDRTLMINIFYKLIKNKKLSKLVENGLFNWTIEYSDKNDEIKKWSNPKFKDLYVRKAISLYDNLNKKSHIKNTRLLVRLKKKEFDADKLAFMTPQELFPEHWKADTDELNRINSQAWEDRIELTTDLFECSRCKKRQCTYYELQVRSSDEALSVYICCQNCGKRWVQ